MKKVSAIILNWNRKKDTIETIRSLSNTNLGNFTLEIVVVDNGSEDDSVEEINKIFRKIDKTMVSTKMIVNKKNLGFCEGNNTGVRWALDKDADYVMLLNDDTLVDKNLIKNLIAVTKNKEGVGAVSPKIYFAPGFEFHKDRYTKAEVGKVIWYAGGNIDWKNVYGTNRGVDEVDKGQYDDIVDTDFATGCCVLFPSKVLRQVGLLDKKYFAYLEDADLSQRIINKGFKVIYAPKAVVWHKVSQSSGIGSELNDYFITRNRLLFGLKFAPLRAKIALARESFRILRNGRKWQKVAVRDFYKFNFGKGSWKNEK